MPSTYVRRLMAGLPLAVLLCGANVADAAPLSVTGVNALSPEGPATFTRTSSTASTAPATSADGSITAFVSNAEDLGADHPAGTAQIYFADRRRGITRLVSRADGASGAPGAGSSSQPSISADGRYIAFVSASNNLSDEDTDNSQDVYVRDIQSNTTRLVSKSKAGGAANGTSTQPAVSPDGRYVAYTSTANNLSPLDGDGTQDVFVFDRATGDSKLVSLGSDGLPALGNSQNPDISTLGQVVTYESTASNLAAGDAVLLSDVFAFDATKGATELVSVPYDGSVPAGGSYAPSISADGRVVAFESDANLTPGANALLRDVFARDRSAKTTTLVSRAAGTSGAASDLASDQPAVSPDGDLVAFRSYGTNLSTVDNDLYPDVFVRDITDGSLALASRAVGGPAANNASGEPDLSAAGAKVVFSSKATNLTSPAPGGGTNVFQTSLKAQFAVTATEPPAINASLSRFDTDVKCNAMCLVFATGKITVTDAQGGTSTRNAAGYGAQMLSSNATKNLAVTLVPGTSSWLRKQLEAGKSATVEIKIQATSMSGGSATTYSRGPVTLPAAAG